MTDNLKLKDDELMFNFQKGDEEGFNEIVRRYKSPLANFVLRYLGSYDESMDVVQETFIRVYRYKNNYKDITKFSTWIYTIAANLAKTELRKRKRFSFFSLGFSKSGEDSLEIDIPETAYSPEQETDKKIRADLVQKALSKLPVAYREAVILRDIMELSYDEISVITKLPKGTVKSKINRGRIILHNLLKDFPIE